MNEIKTHDLINQIRIMAAQAQGIKPENAAGSTQFNEIMQKTLGEVNQLQLNTDDLRSRFELGDPQVSVGEVMIATQKSTLAFEATLKVRNKLVQAYEDIMNMPI